MGGFIAVWIFFYIEIGILKCEMTYLPSVSMRNQSSQNVFFSRTYIFRIYFFIKISNTKLKYGVSIRNENTKKIKCRFTKMIRFFYEYILTISRARIM